MCQAGPGLDSHTVLEESRCANIATLWNGRTGQSTFQLKVEQELIDLISLRQLHLDLFCFKSRVVFLFYIFAEPVKQARLAAAREPGVGQKAGPGKTDLGRYLSFFGRSTNTKPERDTARETKGET